MADFGYPKHEKLKQKKEIALLFSKGKWKNADQIRLKIISENTLSYNKIGVSVSKRDFKKAVDRNRIKRLLREAYRLHKKEFSEAFGSQNLVMLFWASKEKPQHYKEVEDLFLKLCKSKK